MEIVLSIFVYSFIAISFLMLILYCINLVRVKKYINTVKEEHEGDLASDVHMMILIPVLREQNIICDTLDYFNNLYNDKLHISLCIAGTVREKESLAQYGFSESTQNVVERYVATHTLNSNLTIDFFEAEDKEKGDRASQLNYAAISFFESGRMVDIIGVYDADSRPTINTLREVARRFLKNPEVSYQQPAFFVEAANEMTQNRENSLLVANALYQNTWSIISEIPMWIRYAKEHGKGGGNFYCIGHGEFFPKAIYDRYKFPEREVTDGIQIGYRLAMNGEQVEILDNYCNDDVPHKISALVNQHKRWYGGCMRLKQAQEWCKENGNQPKISTLLGGYWSQFRWAFTANLYLISIAFAIITLVSFQNYILLILLAILGIVYCYLLPLVCCKISPKRVRVSWKAFVLLPVAIYVKSIGPNLFWINRMFGRDNKYGKVER